MKAYSRWIALVLFAVVLPFVPSWAQEAKAPEAAAPAEEEDEDRLGWLFVEVSDWVAEAGGLEYVAATLRDPADAYGTTIIRMPVGTDERARYRAGYIFNHNVGEVMFTWYSHEQEREIANYSPGIFLFGEAPVHPYQAGINDDGTADGMEVETLTRSRDLRVDFQRIGFQSPRVMVKWFVGLRRVQHERRLTGTYYALVPMYQGEPLPPLLYPQPTPDPNPLTPAADVAHISSKYNGVGAEAGADFTFPLNRYLYLEAGLNFALLRGQMQTNYTSLTHMYALMVAPTYSDIDYILAPPFDEFDGTDASGNLLINGIRQFDLPLGLSTDQTTTAQVLETYLGIRWKAWRGLEAFVGYRNSAHLGVGVDIRPSQATFTRDPSTGTFSATIAGTDRTDHDAIYQGIYLGVSYKF